MEQGSKSTAGVIGLGIIGGRVAARLRRAGWQVWVWNRTVRPEPNFLSSPAEVAESARHIQVFVSNGPALLEVMRAMAPALTPEHIVMNHATVSPSETKQAAAIAKEKHAAFLDIPFTGSRDAAEKGQIVYYAGGDAAVLEQARAQLEASARQILPVGDIGQASVLKIATNIIAAAEVGALAEALALLDRHGVELHKLPLALEGNAARSGVIDMKTPPMLSGDFEPRFSLKHMFKDIQLALAMADEKDLELPTASAFAGAAMAGIQRGWGESDFSAVSRLFGYPGRGHTPPPAPSAAPVANPPAEAAALPTEQQPKPPTQDPAAAPSRKFWGFLGNKK
ncbi:MAG: NAD(P)-dependent oxidoreductase [Terrimicrobiaceae bacterium]|jgi:3-hydroxyisobutyrate dehydrogenase-like beta-hydroxyacid dehydrogenase